MDFNVRQIEQIVERVVSRLQDEGVDLAEFEMENSQSAAISGKIIAKTDAVTEGVFQDLDQCIDAVFKAQKKLVALPLTVRENLIQAIRDTGLANAEKYAAMEFAETDLGKECDNVLKVQAASRVMGMEDLSPEVYSGDKGVTIIERIPVGVIASVNPVTNGTPTIIFNAIMMMSGGNTVVNNPHPKTQKVAVQCVRDLNRAIIEAGGPPNCVCCFEKPSIKTAQALMTDPRIRFIAVTGGHGVVAFATQTGKKVIAGGPGNPPVVVDETADLDRAASCIVEGASFANCTACASEKEIFVVNSVADQLKEKLIQNGAYALPADKAEELLKHIFKEIKKPGEPGVINMDYIGKPPSFILKSIGVNVGPEVKIVIIEADKNHPLVWTEQIMPVLPFVRCENVDEAIEAAFAAEQKNGHTLAIHSNNVQNIKKMASRTKSAAFVKNGSCGLASVGVAGEGYTSFHIATNGEGQTRPRMFTMIRRLVIADDLRYRYGN